MATLHQYVLVLFLISTKLQPGISEFCIFGNNCAFQCHCSQSFIELVDDCDNITGTCSEKNCAMYQGEGVGTTYTPWYSPGCQLGDVGLEKVIYGYLLNGTQWQIPYTIRTPYGTPDPPICLFPNPPVPLNDLQFVIDFEQTVNLVILTVNSKYETSTLFDAYHNGSCQCKSYVADSIMDKTEENQCKTIYPTYKMALYFACNKRGKYVMFTTAGCSLKEHGVENICIESVKNFGYPVREINCRRCLTNDSAVLRSNIQSYVEEFNALLVGTVEENNTLSLSSFEPLTCGNGIWCEVCEAGWLPPGCVTPCPTGFYGFNCSNLCAEAPKPEHYHCNKGYTCDHVSGEFLYCSEGCEIWYTGNHCDHHISPLDSYPEIINIKSGHNFISFELQMEFEDDLAEFYQYMVEYSLMKHPTIYLHPAVLLPSSQPQFLEFKDLDARQTYSFGTLSGRHNQNILEMTRSETIYITTGCLYAPAISTNDETDLYVTWDTNITLLSCGQVNITAVMVKSSSLNNWKDYAVSSDINGVLLRNIAPDTEAVRIRGDSNLGYKVLSNSTCPQMQIITTEIDKEEILTFKPWDMNYLVIVLLVLSGVLTILIIVLASCLCQNRDSSPAMNMEMEYLTQGQHPPNR